MEKFIKIIEQAEPILREQFKKAIEKIGLWFMEKITDIDWEQKIDSFFSAQQSPDTNNDIKITKVEKECLNKTDLIEIAKQKIVSNANEVLEMLNDKASNVYVIYIAYSKNKEILPKEENNYVIIKTTALTKDVQSLFNGHELIILK